MTAGAIIQVEETYPIANILHARFPYLAFVLLKVA